MGQKDTRMMGGRGGAGGRRRVPSFYCIYCKASMVTYLPPKPSCPYPLH